MAKWDPKEAERLVDAVCTQVWIWGFEPAPWAVFEAALAEAVSAQDLSQVRAVCRAYREIMRSVSQRGRFGKSG